MSFETWEEIKELSGIDYPPQTKGNWLELLMLAGFSQEFADSVFLELGYSGYEQAQELPQHYFSVGREDMGHAPLLTESILAGLRARQIDDGGWSDPGFGPDPYLESVRQRIKDKRDKRRKATKSHQKPTTGDVT